MYYIALGSRCVTSVDMSYLLSCHSSEHAVNLDILNFVLLFNFAFSPSKYSWRCVAIVFVFVKSVSVVSVFLKQQLALLFIRSIFVVIVYRSRCKVLIMRTPI